MFGKKKEGEAAEDAAAAVAPAPDGAGNPPAQDPAGNPEEGGAGNPGEEGNPTDAAPPCIPDHCLVYVGKRAQEMVSYLEANAPRCPARDNAIAALSVFLP